MKLRLLLGLVLLASPAWALPPVSVSLGYSGQVFTGRSYDLVAGDDTVSSVRVGAGYSFALARGWLDVDAAFSSGGSGDSSHGGYVPAYFALRGLEAGVGYRYPLFAHLQPYVHLGAGWDWATLTLLGSSQLTQTVNNVSGDALLGAQIPFKLGPSDSKAPSMLMDLGIGYIVRPGAGFHAMRPQATPQPEDPISHASTNLGTLPMSAIQYRVLMTLRL